MILNALQHHAHGNKMRPNPDQLLIHHPPKIAVREQPRRGTAIRHIGCKIPKVGKSAPDQLLPDMAQAVGPFAGNQQSFPGSLRRGHLQKGVQLIGRKQTLPIRPKTTVPTVPGTIMGQDKRERSGIGNRSSGAQGIFVNVFQQVQLSFKNPRWL